MKTAIVGLVAVGAAIALRPVVRRLGQKMREHCERMAAQFGPRGTMREHCEQMAAHFEGRGEAAHTMPECCEQMDAQFEVRDEVVGRT
jgi:hypothetical protein